MPPGDEANGRTRRDNASTRSAGDGNTTTERPNEKPAPGPAVTARRPLRRPFRIETRFRSGPDGWVIRPRSGVDATIHTGRLGGTDGLGRRSATTATGSRDAGGSPSATARTAADSASREGLRTDERQPPTDVRQPPTGWILQAPGKFRGNREGFAGGRLAIAVRPRTLDGGWFRGGDVLVESPAGVLVHEFARPQVTRASGRATVTIPLAAEARWIDLAGAGPVADDDRIRAVLGDVRRLRIRTESGQTTSSSARDGAASRTAGEDRSDAKHRHPLASVALVRE